MLWSGNCALGTFSSQAVVCALLPQSVAVITLTEMLHNITVQVRAPLDLRQEDGVSQDVLCFFFLFIFILPLKHICTSCSENIMNFIQTIFVQFGSQVQLIQ